MINISYLLKKIKGSWKKINPEEVTEDELDGIIIKTVSGKVYRIKEITEQKKK